MAGPRPIVHVARVVLITMKNSILFSGEYSLGVVRHQTNTIDIAESMHIANTRTQTAQTENKLNWKG